MDKEYICLSCENTYKEDELNRCPHCRGILCPECDGEIATIEEYNRAMKEKYAEDR